MADKRITELPDGTTAAATDVVPIVRAGENYKLALSALAPAADTQVLFKDGTLVAGSADFVFNKTLKQIVLGGDVCLVRDAANVLALRNGANAQELRVYGTYTDPSNCDRFRLGLSGGIYYMGTEKYSAGVLVNGTVRTIIHGNGKASGLEIRNRQDTTAGSWSFMTAALAPATDSVTDLGTSALRIKTGYFGGTAAAIPVVVKAHATQTANLCEWQNSAGTALVAVSATGDVLFAGAGTGLPYGAMYGTELTQSQVLAQNTWYPVNDAAISDGTGGLNLVTHDGAGKLTATNAGRYLLSYSLTSEMNANNKHIELGYMINGTAGLDGQAHTESITNQEITLSASAIVVLTAGQYVQVCFRTTDAGSPTLLIDDVNLTMVGIGG